MPPVQQASTSSSTSSSNYHGNDVDFLFKLVIVGDSGVGKTSLLLKYVDDVFTETFIATIGVDFKIRTFEMEGKKVKLQIWDTAGQDRFRNIVSTFYRNADGIIIVYDVTDITSFHNVEHWLKEIDRYARSSPQTKLMLVGNKCDLESKREVPKDDACAVAAKSAMTHMETSAKTSKNIESLFMDVTKDLMKIHSEREYLPTLTTNPRLGDSRSLKTLGFCSC